MFKENSVSMYNCSESQYTILEENLQDLNESGWAEYNRVLALVEARKFKGVITNHLFTRSKSGSLFRDRNNKHFHPGDLNYLNAWNNLYVRGVHNGAEISTSVVQFVGKDGKWVYTISGSLYELN